MTLEHVVPRVAGGSSSLSNLAVTHFECNQRRGADPGDWQPWFVPMPQPDPCIKESS